MPALLDGRLGVARSSAFNGVSDPPDRFLAGSSGPFQLQDVVTIP